MSIASRDSWESRSWIKRNLCSHYDRQRFGECKTGWMSDTSPEGRIEQTLSEKSERRKRRCRARQKEEGKRKTVLKSVSRGIRTPLAVKSGCASSKTYQKGGLYPVRGRRELQPITLFNVTEHPSVPEGVWRTTIKDFPCFRAETFKRGVQQAGYCCNIPRIGWILVFKMVGRKEEGKNKPSHGIARFYARQEWWCLKQLNTS